MAPHAPLESEVLHALKNHLALIISLSELVMSDLPEGELRSDLASIHRAGHAALELVPLVVRPPAAL